MSEVTSGSAQTSDDGIVAGKESKEIIAPVVDDYKKDMFKYKNKTKELEDKIKEYELKEAEAKGNLQDVINKLRDENKNLKGEVATSKMSFAQGKIEESIKTEALKRGCTDADTFYRLIDSADINTIELDGKYNTNKEDVQGIIEKYSKKLEHLGFFKNKVVIADGTPRGGTGDEVKVKAKPLEELTHAELMALAEKSGLKRIQH